MSLRVLISGLLASALSLLLVATVGPAPATSGVAERVVERDASARVKSPPARVRYANAVVKATNHVRAQRDRTRLRRQACLQRFANQHARRMAKQRRMFHQPLGRIQRRCGTGSVAENVAYGFPTGRAAVRVWMRSPGHRANILRKRYRLIGVGARKAGGHWYVSQVFGRRG